MSIRLFSIFKASCLVLLAVFTACNSDSEIDIGSLSSDAQIMSFAVVGTPANATDSVTYPALKTAKFTIVNKGSYQIYNVDSLPQHTDIRALHVTLSYSASGYTQLVYKDRSGADSISTDNNTWTSPDSIKFIKTKEYGYLPRLKVTAADKTERLYSVEFNIHQVDPDSIRWINMTPANNKSGQLLKKGENKTILNADSTYFYSLTKESNSIYIYNSPITGNAPIWSNLQKTNLPTNTTIKSFQLIKDHFIVAAENGIYSATVSRPSVWTAYTGNNIIAYIGMLQADKTTSDELLVIQKTNDGRTVFAKINTSDLNSCVELNIAEKYDNLMPEDFPTKEFSVVQESNLNQSYIMVTGGKTSSGEISKHTWLINKSSSDAINLLKGSKHTIADYSKGVSTFAYNSQMYLMADSLYTSSSYGDSWSKRNKKQKMTNMTTEGRNTPSIVVDKNNYIWIFGGRTTKNEYLVDIWRGRLNKLAYSHK